MKFKEFSDWCNQRACDGCWSAGTAIFCMEVGRNVNKLPFWKREKAWKQEYEALIVEKIIKPIEQKMKDINQRDGTGFVLLNARRTNGRRKQRK